MSATQTTQSTMTVQMTYRAWVDAGARGFFLTPGVAVNPIRLINPMDRSGGYFVRRDTRDPVQQERRAQLHDTDKEDGERDDRRALHRTAHTDSEAAHEEPWILTHRVERAADVVSRGCRGRRWAMSSQSMRTVVVDERHGIVGQVEPDMCALPGRTTSVLGRYGQQ